MQSRELSRKRTTKGMWHLIWILRYTGNSRQIVRGRFQREETEQKRRKRYKSCVCLWGQMVQEYMVTSGCSAFTQSMVGNGFPQWFRGKETTCNEKAIGDAGSIPGSGRSPGGGHGNPLQYSSLENFMYSQTRLKWLSTQAHGREWLDSKLFHPHLTPGSVNKVASSYAGTSDQIGWPPG